jgi:hypothetical protein
MNGFHAGNAAKSTSTSQTLSAGAAMSIELTSSLLHVASWLTLLVLTFG